MTHTQELVKRLRAFSLAHGGEPAIDKIADDLERLACHPAIEAEELVKRLRKRMRDGWGSAGPDPDCQEAADLIERLTAPTQWPGEEEIARRAERGLTASQLRYIPDIVANAMQTAWDAICSDTGCHPDDIVRDFEGRKGHLGFTRRHWSALVGRIVAEQLRRLTPASRSEILELCDWPDEQFKFYDEPGEHDPCYIIMPGGSMIPLCHHAVNGVDQARAKFMIDACNAALALPAGTVAISDGWRLISLADLTNILSMLPPKPIVKDGQMFFYQDPNAASRLHQIRDAFDRMLSAAPQPPKGTGWQPIETAPKDGTRVDLWCRSAGFHGGGHCRITDCWYFDGKWWRDDFEHGDDQCRSEVHRPTHWMPLPAAPQPADGDAK